MKVSSAGAVKSFYTKVLAVLCAAVFMIPAVAFCQEEDAEETLTRERTSTEPQTLPGSNDGIWQNNNAAGTRDNGNSSSNANAANNTNSARPGAAGAAARPNGSVADGRDPGGNPDVPFDPNMNLAFLVTGIGFAYFIFRKKFKVATVTANK